MPAAGLIEKEMEICTERDCRGNALSVIIIMTKRATHCTNYTITSCVTYKLILAKCYGLPCGRRFRVPKSNAVRIKQTDRQR